MRTIYLLDYLGVHCGMDYYLEAFRNVLSHIPGCRVEILSNFPDREGSEPFFRNQYKGAVWQKGLNLLRNLARMRRFIRRHPDDIFIYLSYGNRIDLLFMKIVASARRHIIDIHEGIAQNVDAEAGLRKSFASLYSDKIKTVISHSARTEEFLRDFGYRGRTLSVPHFKYVFPKHYDMSRVGDDVARANSADKINLLFFGNLNRSKGVDILLRAFNELSDKKASRFNLVVAGKDFDGSVREVTPKPGRNVSIIARHITDDELRYLYSGADFLCLPYRKTSQSGILEMAFYFKKPIIASDVDYFKKMLTEFPSFGVLAHGGAEGYAKALRHIPRHGAQGFFKDDEYSRYENRVEIENFKKEFASWLSSTDKSGK